MELKDAEALKEAMTGACNTFDKCGIDTTITRAMISCIDNVPDVDAIPVDWMVQRMNETSSGSGMNVELNHALFTVSVEWERWKKKRGEDGGRE